MTSKLTDHTVIIFDVYGTLVDWETGIYTALKPIIPSSWSRTDALQAFASVENDLQAQHPDMLYSDLLATAHQVLHERLKAHAGHHSAGDGTTLEGDPALNTSHPSTSSNPPQEQDPSNPHTKFARSLRSWPVFPDTVRALQVLSNHFKLCVLSNVDRPSFTTYTLPQLSSISSSSPFSFIVTAQDTGAYKPSLIGFNHILSLIQKDKNPKEEVLVVAQSLFHDHGPANQLGLKSVWIDREGAVMGVAEEKWTWRFETLGDMADALSRRLVGALEGVPIHQMCVFVDRCSKHHG